jgi:hypothetical protein
MTKPVKSINRFQARELEQKVIPSIKLLSKYMHNTTPQAPDKTFFGYKVPSGEFVDKYGIKWQVQLHCYRTKSDFIKTNEIKPILKKGLSMFKIRIFISLLIDKINKW